MVSAAGLTCDEVLSGLGTGYAGLSSDDAADRLRQFGPNTPATHRGACQRGVVPSDPQPDPGHASRRGPDIGDDGGGTNAVIVVVIVALSVGLGFSTSTGAEVGHGSPAKPDPPRSRGAEGRTLMPGPGHEPGARRRGVAAHRGPGAGRPPPADRRRTRVRRRSADRRVDAGSQIDGDCRRPPGAGPARVCVHGDHRPPGLGAGRGGPPGREDRRAALPRGRQGTHEWQRARCFGLNRAVWARDRGRGQRSREVRPGHAGTAR